MYQVARYKYEVPTTKEVALSWKTYPGGRTYPGGPILEM